MEVFIWFHYPEMLTNSQYMPISYYEMLGLGERHHPTPLVTSLIHSPKKKVVTTTPRDLGLVLDLFILGPVLGVIDMDFSGALKLGNDMVCK